MGGLLNGNEPCPTGCGGTMADDGTVPARQNPKRRVVRSRCSRCGHIEHAGRHRHQDDSGLAVVGGRHDEHSPVGNDPEAA